MVAVWLLLLLCIGFMALLLMRIEAERQRQETGTRLYNALREFNLIMWCGPDRGAELTPSALCEMVRRIEFGGTLTPAEAATLAAEHAARDAKRRGSGAHPSRPKYLLFECEDTASNLPRLTFHR